MKRPSGREVKPQQKYTQAELETLIRRRAYELYEQRGFVDGHDLDDWLQAEAASFEIAKEAAAAQ